MEKDFINYGILIDDAMHVIVKKALEVAKDRTKLGNHHFFISFLTKFPGVNLSDKLQKKYPHEMTIVLQFQYEDLEVKDDEFSVILSFDNVKERIVIPFAALTAFADPSVKFGLQFRHIDIEDEIESQQQILREKQAKDPTKKGSSTKLDLSSPEKTNVVKLDVFRNKKKDK